MSFTCVYFLLILYKFARNVSLRKNAGPPGMVAIWEMERISPLVFAFLRDSAFYFFLGILGNLLNLVFEIVFVGRALIPMGTVRGGPGWADDIELDERAFRAQPSTRNLSTSSGNFKGGSTLILTQSGRQDSLHRSDRFGVETIDTHESRGGAGARADKGRFGDHELDSWLVVDSRG
ncbi:hypothetical protein BN946_scf184910.g7 [Trametes cinnabarina]|uniref:Uncharacterized protein n=1 Tax=Pycnoporus cinnabarinus TaxID=5643 RepID=A0A060SGF8_PYCCI|nr:hypothetical protein BN946_scf184910.g7 [Trametes cinnabarina]